MTLNEYILRLQEYVDTYPINGMRHIARDISVIPLIVSNDETMKLTMPLTG